MEMSLPFVVQISDAPFPYRVLSPCALTWNNVTIIWGGLNSGPLDLERLSVVYCFISGEWTMKKTSGDVPQQCGDQSHTCYGGVCFEYSAGQYRAPPQVVNDQMYVLGSPCGDDAAMYSLDLKLWTWTRLSARGTPPNRNIWQASSFSHGGKLYFFGGTVGIELPEHEDSYEKSSPTAIRAQSLNAGRSRVAYVVNDLFCFDIEQNSWQWPAQHGDVPSPRYCALTINNEGKVFLFGGIGHIRGENHGTFLHQRGSRIRFNDLYTLDMSNMLWKRVHGDMAEVHGDARDKVPKPSTRFHSSSHKSFLRLSTSTAVLYGTGSNTIGYPEISNHHDDCFLLNLERAKSGVEPTSIWTRVRSHMAWRCHGAVSVGGSLWAIGGKTNDTPENMEGPVTSEVVKMTVRILPLRQLAMEGCRRHFDASDPRLEGSALPFQLKNELEAYRELVGEGSWLCRQSGCVRCQQSLQ